MTRDDIIRMMREAGMSFHLGLPFDGVVAQLARFAAIVASAEREACAKACDEFVQDCTGLSSKSLIRRDSRMAWLCASKIRDRGDA